VTGVDIVPSSSGSPAANALREARRVELHGTQSVRVNESQRRLLPNPRAANGRDATLGTSRSTRLLPGWTSDLLTTRCCEIIAEAPPCGCITGAPRIADLRVEGVNTTAASRAIFLRT